MLASPPPEVLPRLEEHGVVPPITAYIEAWSHALRRALSERCGSTASYIAVDVNAIYRKPSFWKAPEPTTVSSAILSHCSTVLPGGGAAAAGLAVPVAATSASAATATARLRKACCFI